MTNFSHLIRRTAATVATGILVGTALTSGLPTTANADDYSGTIAVSNGTLAVELAPDSPHYFEAEVLVIGDRRILTFQDEFAPLDTGSGCTTIDTAMGPQVTCPSFQQIVVRGGHLRDFVDLTVVRTPTVVLGGDEDDRLLGGRGNDRIYGEGGDDWVEDTDQPGQLSSDRLDGGAGDYDILITGFGADTYVGGPGAGDRVLYQNQYNGSTAATKQDLTIKADQVANDGAAGEGDFVANDIEWLNGGSGNDLLVAPTLPASSTAVTMLTGEHGNDTLIGSNRGDILWGEGGNDFADGRGGIDECAHDTEVKVNCEP